MDFSKLQRPYKFQILASLILPVSLFSTAIMPVDSGNDRFIFSSLNPSDSNEILQWNDRCQDIHEGKTGDDNPEETSSGQDVSSNPKPEQNDNQGNHPLIEYHAQSGDTVSAVASHFDVSIDEIQSSTSLVSDGFLSPGQLLLIPDRVDTKCCSEELLPDSELVYSETAIDFNIQNFISTTDGYLSYYREALPQGEEDAAGIIYRVAINQSVNPRVLIALLEYQSSWIYGKPVTEKEAVYPIGWVEQDEDNLYAQLRWTSGQLNCGYYGWRDGSLKVLSFTDGSQLRLSPALNAGTVALQFLFSRLMTREEWENALYGEDDFMSLYELMFDDPWYRDEQIAPLIEEGLTQPPLELPLEEGAYWNLTGGPHAAYGPYDAVAALDFAPTGRKSCSESYEWVTASASGLVVRSDDNSIVVIDLDGDGYEQTGWALFYVHMASMDRVPAGTYVKTNDKIGHPSCEGGYSSGAHIHIARKYNGEWMVADGAVPFVLSGWRAVAGEKNYKGNLIKDDIIIEASDVGSAGSLISH